MEGRQIPLILALAVAVALLFAMPVVGSGVAGSQVTQVENNTTSEDTSAQNGSFGEQLSAFMQSSAVDANTTVESGMWNAGVNASATPAQEVTNRTTQLEREQQRLERKVAQLQEKRDQLPAVAYTAQASALRERIRSLQERINGTERTAQRVGVNASALDRLRTQTENMSGPEVSTIARNITDAPRGPPAGVPGNPPSAGPSDDQTGPPENRTGALENRTGQPDVGSTDGKTPQRVGDPGNETGIPAGQQGPPDRTDGQNETGLENGTTPLENQTDNDSGPIDDEASDSTGTTDVSSTQFGPISR